jgi:hypothetical protein
MFLNCFAVCLKLRAASHPNTALQYFRIYASHPVADSASGEIAEQATSDSISQRKQLAIYFHLLCDVGSDTPPSHATCLSTQACTLNMSNTLYGRRACRWFFTGYPFPTTRQNFPVCASHLYLSQCVSNFAAAFQDFSLKQVSLHYYPQLL